MAIDLFETRTMLEMLDQRKPVRTWFLTTFFNRTRTFGTEAVDIDIKRGRRRLAPFVNPKRAGKVIEGRGYHTQSYKPAYVKPKTVTTAEDILKRQAGNVIYKANEGPATMAARKLGEDMADLDEMITRREEWLAAQALVFGQVHIIGEGIDDVVNFQFLASHLPVLSGTDLWSDHANATPLDDLKAWKRMASKDSGISPTIALFGLSAMDNFLKCEQVIGTDGGGKNLFDMRQVDMGKIDPNILPNGVTYYGRLKELGLDLYTYEEWYIDDQDENEYPMMPEDRVLLGSPSARCDRLYGAIKDLDALAPTARFAKTWKENDPSERILMVQSSPLMAPVEVDAFVSATVL